MDLGVEPPSIKLCLGTSPPPGGQCWTKYIYMIMRHMYVCYLQTFQYWAGGAQLSPHSFVLVTSYGLVPGCKG